MNYRNINLIHNLLIISCILCNLRNTLHYSSYRIRIILNKVNLVPYLDSNFKFKEDRFIAYVHNVK